VQSVDQQRLEQQIVVKVGHDKAPEMARDARWRAHGQQNAIVERRIAKCATHIGHKRLTWRVGQRISDAARHNRRLGARVEQRVDRVAADRQCRHAALAVANRLHWRARNRHHVRRARQWRRRAPCQRCGANDARSRQLIHSQSTIVITSIAEESIGHSFVNLLSNGQSTTRLFGGICNCSGELGVGESGGGGVQINVVDVYGNVGDGCCASNAGRGWCPHCRVVGVATKQFIFTTSRNNSFNLKKKKKKKTYLNKTKQYCVFFLYLLLTHRSLPGSSA
jgi:hypothetical protein